ncbi:MAG TPA: excinuclease ABC subunit UvrC [Nitrospiria bacterium]|nr:excinuclease ABC subunit UvrC [Nitrospiria bacterium]
MDLQQKLDHLPSQPGVYLMKGRGGAILYIGKAKALSDRVRSYFQEGAQLSPRIQHLVSQVRDLECLVTASELEALILENNLIKKHRPRYNVVLRDDKNYPYLRLPLQDDYPRLEIVRRVKPDGALYYGPYVPTHALRDTLRLLRRLFPLPNCNIVIDGTAERACIEFEIKRCLAPCTGHQSREDYREMMGQVRLFLEGKDNELLKMLRGRMEVEAARLNFEEAARLRDQVAHIERTLERQRITTTDFADLDVIATARGGDALDFQVLFIRGGMMVGRKDFFMSGVSDASEEDLYSAFIQQFYDKEGLVPPVVVSAVSPAGAGLLERWLSDKRGATVHLTVPQRGKAGQLVALAQENARVSLEDHFRVRRAGAAASQELQRILGLQRLPRRIEAFDISNIMGDQAVGSRVVWEDNRPKKSAYRKFKIRTIQGANDFGMMKEVLIRWYSWALTREEPLPDLMVIDGGKGQLSAALEAMRIVGITDRDVIGLAKEKGDKFERVYLPEASEPIVLEPASPATHLLQRIRDEAHRFAITYHRKLRGRELILSVLDEVEGIGEARKKALLKKFGSLDAIRRASVEDLLTVSGMTRKRAEAVLQRLNANDS